MFASASAAPSSLARVNSEFADAVLNGLTQKGQKTIPPSWLYDEVGSALFEVITVLPEYGVTRAEAALLSHAADEIVRASSRPARIVELGSGTGTKTRHILHAAARHQAIQYVPIDISPAALDNCAKALSGMDQVQIEPIAASYLDGIDVAMEAREPDQPLLLLFLGSTIGNFTRADAASFLAHLAGRMQPGDHLLLGADLVKSRSRLISAYDDPIGVTASFNLNLLARINRELDGDFDIAQFAHEARYNERQSRIEMHLRSRVAQEVRIDALGITVSFIAGETIWTESSHKFRAEEIAHIGQRSGFACVRQWVDGEWGFAETLFRKPAAAR
jgi:L-histidine N-alpha-methyltransferase